ncbi:MULTISPECIES: ABC transporter ATP-binding protein [Halorussus]|uniref:ABC transporter ATP-binding protein n=1 Tax=Halorussus TaxID=1070314 RepID=UPI000E213D67|nr:MULTISPECIES: ABC transporter ATP-binding protein [Halorussus]NHN61626.1 ABC transporter ATP-binding protein [Halorussus sp. JP-T4]
MTNEPLLRVENLRTQFPTRTGAVRAVDGVSFTVERGEIVGLVGESGAGKSVAVQSLLRLVDSPGRIVGGEVTFDGETIVGFEDDEADEADEPTPREEMLSERAMRSQIRGNQIAIIFQDPMESLNPVFTVGDQLREFIELNRDLTGAAARERSIEILREVGIPKPDERLDDYPHEFSGGMRQRVLIAMALACEPKLVIADEPTTALDVTVEGQILDLVDDLQARYDTSFLWVTHDMGVVAEICDRVNVMYLGEVIERADVERLFYDPQHPYTAALLDSVPRPDETVDELRPLRGTMPEPIDPPSGCRFHDRCPDAREVCTQVHPDLRTVTDDGQRAACLKHDTFEADYDVSPPLDGAGEGDAERVAALGAGDDDE